MFTDYRQLLDGFIYNSSSNELALRKEETSARRREAHTAKRQKGRVYFALTEDKMTGKSAKITRERPERFTHPSARVTPATQVAKYTSVALLFMQRDPTAIPFSLSLLQIPSTSHFRNRSCITCFWLRFYVSVSLESEHYEDNHQHAKHSLQARPFYKLWYTSIHLNTYI